MKNNPPVAPKPGARIMSVLYIKHSESTSDMTHSAMLVAGFDMNRPIFASYPMGENDQPSDEGMYLLQEVLAKQ